MANEEHVGMEGASELQLPQWEHVAAKEAGTVTGSKPATYSLKDRFFSTLDRKLPPHHKYLGLKPRTFLLAIMVAFTAILSLTIGLAAGLSTKKRNSDSSATTYSGDLTYYTPGLGACGIVSSNGQNVVAISTELYGTYANPNDSPQCGKKIHASRINDAGAAVNVDPTVVDRCQACATDDIDVPLRVFEQMAEESEGRVNVNWYWI